MQLLILMTEHCFSLFRSQKINNSCGTVMRDDAHEMSFESIHRQVQTATELNFMRTDLNSRLFPEEWHSAADLDMTDNFIAKVDELRD